MAGFDPARAARVLERVDAAVAPLDPALWPFVDAALAPARAAAFLPGWPPLAPGVATVAARRSSTPARSSWPASCTPAAATPRPRSPAG